MEVNEGFVSLSGFDRETALASSSLALDLWADPEDRLRCVAALQRDGSVRDTEFGFRIKSGEVIQCTYAGALIEVEGQSHILSVVRDVSEQRRAVAAVKRSADLLRGILDNLQDAYVRVDAAGRLVMVSPSAARMYGYASTDEMIGLPTESLYADQAARQGIVDELRTSGQVVDQTGYGRRKDGSTFAVSLNAQVFCDERAQWPAWKVSCATSPNAGAPKRRSGVRGSTTGRSSRP